MSFVIIWTKDFKQHQTELKHYKKIKKYKNKWLLQSLRIC